MFLGLGEKVGENSRNAGKVREKDEKIENLSYVRIVSFASGDKRNQIQLQKPMLSEIKAHSHLNTIKDVTLWHV